MRNRLNVIALRETALGFSFRQHGCDVIIPAQFGDKGVPDNPVGVMEGPPAGLTPFKNFLITDGD